MLENVLSLTDLKKAFGERVILDGVTLGVNRGECLGLIGANGAGKSTLMKIVAGLEEQDSGKVVVRGDTATFFLEQDPILPPGVTVSQALLAPMQPMRDLIAEWEAAVATGDPSNSRLFDAIEREDGWDWEHRYRRAVEEVGLVEHMEATTDVLSGGQRKRVALARMLLSRADLLLLDEPTNHLDAETVDWLEEWLAQTALTVILVTHDRYFLDRVVDKMVELRDGGLRVYPGNYTDYLEARAREDDYTDAVRRRRMAILKRELMWARRAPKARRGKQKARLSRIDGQKQEQRELQVQVDAMDITFGQPPRLGKTILELTGLSKAYDPEQPLIENLSLILRKGERYGIIGENGCGKSTLLRMIGGKLKHDSGSIIWGSNTTIAWLDQERTILDDTLTVRQTILPQGGDYVVPGGRGDRMHVVAWLTRFAFPTRTHDMKVTSLSGGERNRLAIARFLLQEANVFLLDEPTNDIDLLTLNVLEEALVEFAGSVLVVTHDRYFLDKVATGIIAFERHHKREQSINIVQGDYTHYRRVHLSKVEEERRAAELAERDDKRIERAKLAAEQPTPEKKGLSWKEQKELEGLEGQIEAAETDVEQQTEVLGDPSIWTADRDRAAQLTAALEASKLAVAELYVRWEELEARQ